MVESSSKNVIQYLPIVSALFIFFGITRLFSFYSEFGIIIVNYLDFSEILTSFLDVIVELAIVMSMFILQYFFLREKVSTETVEKFDKIYEETNPVKRIWQFIKHFFKDSIDYLVVFVIIILTTKYFIKQFKWSDTLSMLFCFMVYLCYYIIVNEIESKHRRFKSSNTLRLVFQAFFYSTILFFYLIYLGHTQAQNILRRKDNFGAVVHLIDNRNINSDSTNYFIGNTRNYVFVYHAKDSTAEIIPMIQVKEITLKKRY